MSERARRAVVSGGGTGIGRATAAALVADGCEVLLLGRREAVLAEAAGELGSAVTWRAVDLGDPAGVAAMAGELAQRWPVVDVVVANAGAPAARPGPGLAALAETWLDAYRANVLSAVLLVEALLPALAEPGGRVLVVGSRAAATGGSTPAYVAAKAALQGWVLSLAAQLGPAGSTANLVAPGWTADTELVAGRIPPDRAERLLAGIAAGRPGAAAEVAAVLAFLASPVASYVNGQVLGVDGGVLPRS